MFLLRPRESSFWWVIRCLWFRFDAARGAALGLTHRQDVSCSSALLRRVSRSFVHPCNFLALSLSFLGAIPHALGLFLFPWRRHFARHSVPRCIPRPPRPHPSRSLVLPPSFLGTILHALGTLLFPRWSHSLHLSRSLVHTSASSLTVLWHDPSCC